MEKITPGLKTFLVVITFLGFTNFILSETKLEITSFLNEVKTTHDSSIEESNTSKETSAPLTTAASTPFSGVALKSAEQPSISLDNPVLEVCRGETSVNLTYSTLGEPTHYSIDFENSALSDVSNATLESNPLNLSIPSSISAGSYSATITVKNDIGTSDPQTFSIQVKSLPTVHSVSNVEACTGAVISSISFSGSIPETQFSWVNDNTEIGLAGSGTGSLPQFTTTNITNTTLTAKITVTPTADGCTGTPTSFNIIVYPVATMNKPDDLVVCNGGATSSIFFSSGNSATTIYRWTNNNTSIGLNSSGEGTLPSFTATNITNSPIVATINVVPIANGCEGTPESFSITVNPSPSFATPQDLVSCNNEVVAGIDFTGSTVSGTSYRWINDTPSIGLADSGDGNIPSFTAQNISTTPVTANVTVTPIANNCEGSPETFTITVNPTAEFTKPADVVVCPGETVNSISFSGSNVTGTAYKWVNNDNLMGLPANGTGDIPSFVAENNTSSPITGQFTVTPVANECEGTSQTFTITINPTATLTDPADLIVCNGELVPGFNFQGSTVANTSFKWTNDNPEIGLSSTGVDTFPSFTATNTTGAPITAQITVTPVALECEGTPQTFTIVVNPSATFSKPENLVLCNGTTSSAVSFLGSNISSTTYKWQIDRQDIGLNSTSGTGDFPSFTALNTTNDPINALVTVTPIANGCDGNPETFSIKVNPSPIFTQPADVIACMEEILAPIAFIGGNVENISYTWENSNTAIGLAANGTGSLPSFTAQNTTDSTISATITVTPFAEGCEGPKKEFTITVHPIAGVNDQDDLFACNEEVLPALSFSGSSVAGTEYTWTNDNTSIGLAESGSGSLPSFTAINNTDQMQVATIKLTPVANGCSGLEKTFQIIVYPTISVVAPEIIITPPTCQGEADGEVRIGTVYGGNGHYLFAIDGENFGDSKTFTGLSAGVHTVFVKDTQRCSFQTEILVPEPEELAMTEASSTPTSCFGGSDGTVTAGTVTGGNGGYLYSIDNINFSSATTFTGLSAGTHTIFVKGSKGCSLQKTVTVNEPAKLNAIVNKTNINCFGGSSGTITIASPSGGSGQYEYSIDSNTWQSSNTFSNLTAGAYQVLIRDQNAPGCVIVLQEALQLSQPSAPVTAEVVTTRTLAYGTSTGTATVNPTGGTPGYTYEWRKKGVTTILQTTKTANNLAAGLYEVTVIDSKGCKFVKEFEIIDAIEAFILSRNTCEIEDNIDAIRTFHFVVEDQTARGGIAPYTYSWNFGTDAINPTRTGIGEFWVDYSTIGNKTITLTVTDSTGETFVTTQDQYVGKCYNPCGKSSNIEFDPNNIYMGYSDGRRIDNTSPDYCDPFVSKYIFIQVDKSANIYNPYIELGFIISNDISGTKEHYYVSGCRDDADIDEDLTVNQPNRVGGFIKLTLEPINFNCGDNLNIDTFYTTWTNVSKKECGQNNNKFCYSTNEPVHVPTELRAEATPTHNLCKNDRNGTITVKASGGYAPYSFSLAGSGIPSQSTNVFYNLAAGNYTVEVLDAAGKKTTVTTTILEPETSVSGTVEVINPSCYGQTGEATVHASGGTPFTTGEPYNYLWNDPSGQTSVTALGLTAGEYTVTIIDANGCQTIVPVTLTQPVQLTPAEAGEDQFFNCGFTSTLLNANIPEVGVGHWTIVSGSGGTIAEPSNPRSGFTGAPGIFTLRWTISLEDGTCGTTSDVNITFDDDCSKIDFDGVDDYITFNNNHGFTSGNFTIEAWVKLHSLTGTKTVLSKRNSANLGEGGYDLVVNNGAPTFRWGNSSVSTSLKLNTQRWYHLAVIFKDSKASLYVDGINVGNSTATNPLVISSPFLIGAMNSNATPGSPQNYFHGWIEEVRMWKAALTEEQLRFMMNQRIEASGTAVKGSVIPLVVPSNLAWASLSGYYRLLSNEIENGLTKDRSLNTIDGILKNIQTLQENTAPLPYISAAEGAWRDKNNWAEPVVWDAPNSLGITGDPITWNIAQISHNFTSGGKDIHLLGLLSESGKLVMANPNQAMDEKNTGQALTITHYLKLNGSIDLVGESQLIQTDVEGTRQTITSVLEESSSGFIERDQQGTANSYNYNYWSSPVSLQGAPNNSTYTIASVMLDGTNSGSPKGLSFGGWHEYADGPYSTPRKISNYWLHKFRGTANVYSEWKHIGSTGILNAGEGYTMKGTSGQAAIEDRQNYVYLGKPNNGTIALEIGLDQNYLLGNPYPSAIDVNDFIMDNLKDVAGGRNTQNVFNGAVYFWDHFAGGNTHILKEYIGGYATRNLLGGVPAISNDQRVNANDEKGSKVPGQYIPVAQGFFINTAQVSNEPGDVQIDGGNVLFKNGQRKFVRESTGSTGSSVFLSPEQNSVKEQEDTRPKIRLDLLSPLKYSRQILVGVDPNTTDGFDLGYDAALNDNVPEDMYWLIKEREYVIQGVPDFHADRVLPLGVKIKEEGEFSISINKTENLDDDVNIFVRDQKEDTYWNLRKGNFKLNLEPGLYHDRFSIVFQEIVAEQPEEKEEPQLPGEGGGGEKPAEPAKEISIRYFTGNKALVITNPGELEIQDVTVYSLNGQILEKHENIPNLKEYSLPVRSYSSAVYIVKMTTAKGVIQKKIIINN